MDYMALIGDIDKVTGQPQAITTDYSTLFGEIRIEPRASARVFTVRTMEESLEVQTIINTHKHGQGIVEYTPANMLTCAQISRIRRKYGIDVRVTARQYDVVYKVAILCKHIMSGDNYFEKSSYSERELWFFALHTHENVKCYNGKEQSIANVFGVYTKSSNEFDFKGSLHIGSNKPCGKTAKAIAVNRMGLNRIRF